jgi:hypothetical protein
MGKPKEIYPRQRFLILQKCINLSTCGFFLDSAVGCVSLCQTLKNPRQIKILSKTQIELESAASAAVSEYLMLAP